MTKLPEQTSSLPLAGTPLKEPPWQKLQVLARAMEAVGQETGKRKLVAGARKLRSLMRKRQLRQELSKAK